VRTLPTSSLGHRTRAILVGALAVVTSVLTVSAALAQESQLDGKLRAGEEVLVPADARVEGDLYASAGLVRVEGTVDGDLLVSAGQVQITGTVTGDLMAAGGTLAIDGEVDGDVRVAGGRIVVTGTVGEDLLVAGGQVRLASSGAVGEDLVFGTGQMTLDGDVAGDVLGSAGAYVRRGSIGGTEDVTVREPEDAAPPTVADRILDTLGRLISVLLVGALALLLAPRLVEAPAETLRGRPLMSLLIGVVALVVLAIGVPVLIVIAAMVSVALVFVGLGDLVGLLVLALVAGLVLLALGLVFVLAFAAPVIVGMVLAGLVVQVDAGRRRWWALLVGVLVVVVASAVPVVGGWVAVAVALFGLGSVLLRLVSRNRMRVTEASAATSV
jgi:cytoskeletal protein CcmA (bactofilin family)